MERSSNESFFVKREQTVLGTESVLAQEEKLESEAESIEVVVAAIQEDRISGEIPRVFVDKLLIQNGIQPSTSEAEEFMRAWDREVAMRVIHERVLRREAYDDIKRLLTERLQRDPVATPEEVSAGVYREGLEPQVRDAVMVLRGKGYDTFESGFDNAIMSPQFMGFHKMAGEALSVDVEELNRQLTEKGVRAEFREIADRYTLMLTSSSALSLQSWKEVWDTIAEILPDRGRSAVPSMVRAATFFREKQKKIQAGDDVYLGEGLSLKDGKVVKRER